MDGIINVYKPCGMTSFDVVYKIKKIVNTKKVGHTGTLDPDADGVLPICIGNGTKLSNVLMDTDKKYRAVMRLGITTDTLDISGNVIKEYDGKIEYTNEMLIETINSFLGDISQIPPMYSAIKVNGQKLYKLARKGIEIERKSRTIKIYSIDIIEINGCEITLDISCSKGTYIRTLCNDIGEKLGFGAIVTKLTRLKSAGFLLEDSVTLETLKKDGVLKYLIPIEEMFNYEKIYFDGENLRKILNGNPIMVKGLTENNMYRVYDKTNNSFLCISKFDDGILTMQRCFFGGKNYLNSMEN